MTIKDSKYVKNFNVNHLHLIFRYVNEYFEEFNKNKYLALVSTNESNAKVKNMKNCKVKSEISLSK